MANRHVRPRSVATMVIGARETLRNGIWVLGRALPSESSTDGSTTQRGGEPLHRLVGSVKHVGSTLKGALPGQNTAQARLARAKAAGRRKVGE